MNPFDILGFGALNADCLGSVDRIETDGETVVTRETRSAGGSAANTVSALARLGMRCGFIGAAGDDRDAEMILTSLTKDGVDVSHIVRKSGVSGVALGLSDREGNRTLTIFPGVNSTLTIDDLPDPKKIQSRWVHLSSFTGMRQLEIQKKWVAGLPPDTSVSFSPGIIYSRLGIVQLKPLLSRVRVLFLTETELQVLTNSEGATVLFALGIEMIAVTRGAEGCTVYTKNGTYSSPATSRKVVDAVGAGDAFAGGFLYGVLQGWDPQTCAVSGNVLAGFCVGAAGARDGLPTKQAFEKELAARRKQTVLVIGNGGREHTIGWKLSQSPEVKKIYFAPGNGGTGQIGENIEIAPDDISGLLAFVRTHDVDFTVVGPEVPLALGLVDRFQEKGYAVFGPGKQAAMLESSKAWAVGFMKRHTLPHPESFVCSDIAEAKQNIKKLGGQCVVKADGLCQGKGVYVCSTVAEGIRAAELLMVKKVFGSAASQIIIQERLIGKEVSMMAFCDGSRAVPLIAAQDYKRVYDGDRGGNTGGMGSLSPATRVRPALFKKIHRLLTLTVDAMKEEGIPFHGILYAGMMVVGDTPYILEYNCRFGDPETQTQLPLLASDLFPVLRACATGTLTPGLVRWSDRKAVCVVLASEGYPGPYESGKPIRGINAGNGSGVTVFHAGTKSVQHSVITHGGRVLGVVATADTVEEARKKVYGHIGTKISFDHMYFRKDIGV